jgi:hypothetical protein
MIYIFCWILNYILLLVSRFTRRKRLAAGLVILVLGSLVVLRGRVGADTGIVYESMAKELMAGGTTEPLFAGLLIAMVLLFPTPLLAVTMGIGSIFVLTLFLYVRRADDRELFILQGFLIPAFFWGLSISGQRYGLAFAFLLLVMQSVRLKQFKWAVAFSVIAILIHYSSVLFLVLWGAMILKISRTVYLRFLGGFAVVSVLLVTFASEHFEEKLLLYFGSDYTAPSSWSGLSNILITMMLLAGIVLGSLERAVKTRVVVVCLVGLLGSVIVTQFSYGGLRLLGIVETAVVYAALALYEKFNSPFKVKIASMILLAGLLGAVGTYRNMLDEDRVLDFPGRSLPYKFFWQEEINESSLRSWQISVWRCVTRGGHRV